jgi:carbon storage regulator CsrA
MLVVTRKPGQSIRIGGQVRVRVVRLWRDRATIAVEALRETPVAEEELLTSLRVDFHSNRSEQPAARPSGG